MTIDELKNGLKPIENIWMNKMFRVGDDPTSLHRSLNNLICGQNNPHNFDNGLDVIYDKISFKGAEKFRNIPPDSIQMWDCFLLCLYTLNEIYLKIYPNKPLSIVQMGISNDNGFNIILMCPESHTIDFFALITTDCGIYNYDFKKMKIRTLLSNDKSVDLTLVEITDKLIDKKI